MGATERFSRREFQRLLDVTDKQLNYWERLQLVSPRKGVAANRLRRSLVALNEKLSQVQAPLTELRILANGRDVIVEHDGARLEPISGQFVLNFDTRELRDKVRVMPERSAEDWFALALQYEADPASRAEAIDAYHRVLSANPRHVDALINLGMLSYDGGDLEKAVDCFRRAVALEDDNAVAQFNLGSVLEELSARAEARQHWQLYVELDPGSPWCEYARQRLAAKI